MGLPPESAFGARNGHWSPADEIAATHFERSEMWSALLLMAWGAKANELPKLMEFRRPWDKPPEKKKGTSNPAEIAAFLARAGR